MPGPDRIVPGGSAGEVEAQRTPDAAALRAPAERTVALPGALHVERADAPPALPADPPEVGRVIAEERALADFLPDPYLVTDGWGTIHYANAAACALFDRPAGLLHSRPLATLVAVTARGSFRDEVQRLHRLADRAGSWAVAFVGDDGATRPTSVVARAVRDDAGVVVGIRWLLRQGEGAANAAPPLAAAAPRPAADPQSRHAALLAAVGTLLAASVEPDAAMVAVAEALVPVLGDCCAVDLVGESREAAPPQRLHLAGASRDAARPRAALDQPTTRDDPAGLTAGVLAGGGPRIWHGDPAGEAVPACTSALAVPLVLRGRTLGAFTLWMTESGRRHSSRDLDVAVQVAERAALALENTRLLQAAQRAREVKSNFLAAMSHELRTPLTTVLGYAELLGDGVVGPVSDTQRHHLERISASGEQLLALVDEILAFSRAESGEARAHPADVDGAAVARGALAVVEPLATAKGLALRVQLPAGGLPMHTDAGKLRQILVHLLGNAVKFTDAGEVELTARAHGARVWFEVRDTGPGIAADDHERIFDPFWQVVQNVTRRHGGTGLGLSLVRTLARLLGGDVGVASAPGGGSRFTVQLPATLAPLPLPHPTVDPR